METKIGRLIKDESPTFFVVVVVFFRFAIGGSHLGVDLVDGDGYRLHGESSERERVLAVDGR